jgi:hypothetical protein
VHPSDPLAGILHPFNYVTCPVGPGLEGRPVCLDPRGHGFQLLGYSSHGGGVRRLTVRDRAKQSCSSDPPHETCALALEPVLGFSDLQDL